MKTSIRSVALVLSLGITALASPAFADDDDKAACADKAQGDTCTRGDGDPGVCVPDDSDPVLTCEDDAGSSSGTGSSSGSGSSDDDGSSSGTGSSGTGSSDDGSGDDDSSDGCTASPRPASSWGAPLVGLFAVGAAVMRSRRSRNA